MSAIWQCGRFALSLSRPLIMGVLNATPDSFSDGGLYGDPLSAVARGRTMIEEGVDIIDIGGESTRPGAVEVPVSEEIARVRPVASALVRDFALPLSVDTRHAEVAAACVECGVSIINDISGFRDPAMLEVAAESNAGVIVMHMLGEPKTMQRDPHYHDVVPDVAAYLLEQARRLEDAGVAPERIAIDPGLGFGKTTEHNLEILNRLDEFALLGYPVLIGASRKRFIGEISAEVDPLRRDPGSAAAALWSVSRGASVVRVHDVVGTRQALAVWEAIERGRP